MHHVFNVLLFLQVGSSSFLLPACCIVNHPSSHRFLTFLITLNCRDLRKGGAELANGKKSENWGLNRRLDKRKERIKCKGVRNIIEVYSNMKNTPVALDLVLIYTHTLTETQVVQKFTSLFINWFHKVSYLSVGGQTAFRVGTSFSTDMFEQTWISTFITSDKVFFVVFFWSASKTNLKLSVPTNIGMHIEALLQNL